MPNNPKVNNKVKAHTRMTAEEYRKSVLQLVDEHEKELKELSKKYNNKLDELFSKYLKEQRS